MKTGSEGGEGGEDVVVDEVNGRMIGKRGGELEVEAVGEAGVVLDGRGGAGGEIEASGE